MISIIILYPPLIYFGGWSGVAFIVTNEVVGLIVIYFRKDHK